MTTAMDWPLLAPLTEDARAAVLAAARRRGFAAGEVVFHEGDPADSMHLVESGHLIVRVSTPDGDRATLNVLSAGDIVGELSLVHRDGATPRSATVAALEASQTRVLPATAFHELCDRHPGVQRLLTDMLAVRVRELSSRLLETMYVGLDRRLYRSLLHLADVFGTGTGRLVIPLTQEHLADMVGGTRPSVNQILQRLRTQGIIELGRGRVIVLDRRTLTVKAGLR